MVLVGILTWLIIAMPGILFELHRKSLLSLHALTWAACYAGFLILFLVANRPSCRGVQETLLIVGQSILALACSALQRNGWQPVLLVIIAGQLGHFPPRLALSWILAQSTVLGVILGNSPDGIIVALAYLAFQLFGITTTQIAHSEAEARQALAEANAELRVATGLLEINSRTEERLRIARDLHDLLGHHLSALSLNLEVASHLTEGAARDQVEKSKAITKTLLSDLRDVVSRLRHEEPINLTAALLSLREVIATPALHFDLPSDLTVQDPTVAEVALRAVQEIVTNAVRHSGGRNLWLRLNTVNHSLTIDAHDDGAGTDDIQFGHGLRGIRERVGQVRGEFNVSSMRGRGFTVHVRLPLAAEPAA